MQFGNKKMNAQDYESIRKELIDILSQPGGGPNAFTDLQKLIIEGLDQARKEAVKQDGQALIIKKLTEMDSLIIQTAILNLKSAQKHMEGVHFPLVKFARDLLADQKKELDKNTFLLQFAIHILSYNFIGIVHGYYSL